MGGGTVAGHPCPGNFLERTQTQPSSMEPGQALLKAHTLINSSQGLEYAGGSSLWLDLLSTILGFRDHRHFSIWGMKGSRKEGGQSRGL